MNANLLNDLIAALTAATGGTTSSSDSGFVNPVEDTNQIKFVFVSREHAGDACWYMLNEQSKPAPCPTTALKGKLDTIYQIDTTRGGKGQYKSTKMRLGIKTQAGLYVIENGAETVFSQTIASAILHGNLAIGDTLTIQVNPADQNEKVVFAQVFDADGIKILPPKNFNRSGSVLAAQNKLGCKPPEKKDAATAPASTSAPARQAPVSTPAIEADLPDFDGIDF